MILVEILAVDDVITHLRRHHSFIYDSTYPYDPTKLYLEWDIFQLFRTNSLIQGVFHLQFTG